MSDAKARPQTRPALLPGFLGANAAIFSLIIIGTEFFVYALYVVCILAVIIAVMAAQRKKWWWVVPMIPVAVVWNPVWPLGLPLIAAQVTAVSTSVAFICLAFFLRVNDE